MTSSQWNKVIQVAKQRVKAGGSEDPNAILEVIRQLTLPENEAELDAEIEDEELRVLKHNEPELEAELARVKARRAELKAKRKSRRGE